MSNKRRFAAALCLVFCLVAIPAPRAMAANPNAGGGSDVIMPMMEYINNADYEFSVTNGVAEMYSSVSGYASVTKCKITIELQEKRLLFWDTVETWSSTKNNRRAELTASYSVTEGKSYRMVATVTVWNGSDSETQTMTSEAEKA